MDVGGGGGTGGGGGGEGGEERLSFSLASPAATSGVRRLPGYGANRSPIKVVLKDVCARAARR